MGCENSNLSWLIDPPADFNTQCKRALDHQQEAGRTISSLASRALDGNQLIRLARLIREARAAGCSLAPLTPFRLGLVSNSTTDFIVPALEATAARHGIDLEVVSAGYDQALQDSLSPDSALNRSCPQAMLVAIDWRGLPLRATPGQEETAKSTVDLCLNYLRMIREAIQRNCGAVVIQQNLAPPAESLFGSLDRALPGTIIHVIDEVNRGLAEAVRGHGALLDVAGLASRVGLAQWHSPAEWNMAKLPFAQEFLPLYAEHICRIIAALGGKSRRCLVLDLDNTLWGGVIGDDGLGGIQIAQGDASGEAYLALQRYALALRERGIVLAVCSKNDDEVARRPFRSHPEMLLREEHFAVFQANWLDKAANIQAIAQELSLGLDSFVFVDDNPFERELVRRNLPQVAVPEMPADPAYYVRTLNAAGYFDATSFSSEDARRADFYAGNARRAALQENAGNLEAYLASLKMEIGFQPFDATGRARIAQLINKSNQFNLTTRRYTEADVARIEADPDCFTLQVRLSDAFGDNGMISVVICRATASDVWEFDTWLMSCRVLGRGVERMVLREVLEHAAALGISSLIGVYRPTDRNKLVERHYPDLGFELVEQRADGVTVWKLDVKTARVVAAPMTVRSSGFALRAAAL